MPSSMSMRALMMWHVLKECSIVASGFFFHVAVTLSTSFDVCVCRQSQCSSFKYLKMHILESVDYDIIVFPVDHVHYTRHLGLISDFTLLWIITIYLCCILTLFPFVECLWYISTGLDSLPVLTYYIHGTAYRPIVSMKKLRSREFN